MHAEQLATRPTNLRSCFRSCAPDDMLAALGSTLETSCRPVLHANEGAAVNAPPRASSGEATSAGFAWLLAEAAVFGDAAGCGWSSE